MFVKMFYDWEDFRRGYNSSKELTEANVPLVGDPMEIVSNLEQQIEVLRDNGQSNDLYIVKLQQDLQSLTLALRAERAKNSETMARNMELERELAQRIRLEDGLMKQLEDQDEKYDKAMADVKEQYDSEIERLLSLVGTLSDAEERLVSQLGELEAEAIEQSRFTNSEIGSLSLSLARKEQELTASEIELELIRQRKMSLTELEVMDLSAQLEKITHERDNLRLQTESLQKVIEKQKAKAENLQQELALATLINSWQQNEENSKQGEKIRVKRPQLCRSESLSVAKQSRTQYGGRQCEAV